MDRGRAGGFVTDNNLALKLTKEKQFKEHLQRLEKIKIRKAGSSNTLNNNPPVIVKAALTNPRKIALRNEFNDVVAKENKSLLKRISMILTAPPRISTKDYYDMKKLCPSGTVDAKEAFEMRLREEKTKRFFAGIKQIKPVYNPKQWENDYKKQKFNQKFMRQVKYRRPKDFVDPFAPSKPEDHSSATNPDHGDNKDSPTLRSSNDHHLREDSQNPENPDHEHRQQPESSVKKSKSASHVDRIRAVKSQKGAPGPVRSRFEESPNTLTAKSSVKSQQNHNIPIPKSSPTEDVDEEDENYAFDEYEENEKDLADVGYEQDFEDVPHASHNRYDVNYDDEADAAAALAVAAAAGPRQQSSRGQRRHHSQQRGHDSNDYEYDDGFEPVTDAEQHAIDVVVFHGDNEYSHDGFYGEGEVEETKEAPSSSEQKVKPHKAMPKSEDKSYGYEDDADFLSNSNIPTDNEIDANYKTKNVSNIPKTDLKTDEAVEILSEVETEVGQQQQSKIGRDESLYHHDRGSEKRKPHKSQGILGPKSPPTIVSASTSSKKTQDKSKTPSQHRKQAAHLKDLKSCDKKQIPMESIAITQNLPAIQTENSELVGLQQDSDSDQYVSHTSHKRRLHGELVLDGEPASRTSSKNHHQNRHHRNHHHQHNEIDGHRQNRHKESDKKLSSDPSGAAATSSSSSQPFHTVKEEERKILIATLVRPIKLIREVASSHLPLAILNSHIAHHNSHAALNNSNNNNTAMTGSMLHKAREGFDLQISYMDGSIECWLVNQAKLLITVEGVNTEIPFQAEAEISEQDLATICDLPENDNAEDGTLPTAGTGKVDNDDEISAEWTQNKNSKSGVSIFLRDLDTLTSIATEIVENIELRMDYGSEPRIILNLIHEIDPEEGVQAGTLVMNPPLGSNADFHPSPAGKDLGYNPLSHLGLPATTASVRGLGCAQSMHAHSAPFNIVADDEVEEILLPESKDVSVLTGGIRLPVHYNVQNQSISNINKLIEYAKQSQRVEHVYCLYRARVLKEEQLCIVATVTSSTSKSFKKSVGSGISKLAAAGAKLAQQPAVAPTQNLVFTMPLPSVVQLDTDLFADFAANVVQSLKIEHDARTGINTLMMQSST